MKLGFLIAWLCFSTAGAIEVITERPEGGSTPLDQDLPLGVCTEVTLGKDRELEIYKDFTLMGLISIDPKMGSSMSEQPLLGSFVGTVHLNRIGPPRRLKTLGFLSSVVGRRDKQNRPNALFFPVMLCSEDSYKGNLGYIGVEAFDVARQDAFSGSDLPPSTKVIPRLN